MSINTTLTQMQEASYNIVITDGNSTKNKMQIDPGDIHFFSILWDINEICVEGFITFRDSVKVTEMIPPNAGLRLEVSMKDSIGGSFEFIFVVTKIEKDLSNGSNIEVKMSLIDEYFNYFVNTYKSKGFKNKKASDIAKELVENPESGLISKKVDVKVVNSEKEYENFVIPSNKSLLAFLYNIEKFDNMMCIRNRSSFVVAPKNKISSLAPDMSSKCLFTANPTQLQSPLFCYSFNVVGSDKMRENMVLAKTKSYSLDSKKIEVNEHFIGKTASELSLNTTPLSTTITKGVRTSYLDKNIMDSIFTSGTIQQNSIEIRVNGMFFNKLLNKVGFDTNSTMQGYKEKMPFINGDYYITKIYDIIENGMSFTQHITLSRVGVKA